MTHPEPFSFDVYPGLDAELNAAYKRNVANGVANPGAVATDGLTAVVADAIANQDPSSNVNLAPGFRQNVEDARAMTKKILKLSLDFEQKVPKLNSAEFENVDWDKLQTAHGVMLGAGLQPEVVISPLGLLPDYWRDIYAALPGVKSGGLYINSEVEEGWSDLNAAVGTGWSINVVPGTPEPTIKNVPHDMSKADLHAKLDGQVLDAVDLKTIRTVSERYPDVSTYLMLQAIRLQKGEAPIDAETYTWLRGEFDNGTKAPCAFWRPGHGRVRVFWRVPGYRGDVLGVRPAVRGG